MPNDGSSISNGDAMDKPDPILLSVMANRFMAIAEAMGRSLQQTAISTNVKERLDYSCACMAPNGDLVANGECGDNKPG